MKHLYALLLFILIPCTAFAQTDFSTEAGQAVVMDMATGQILFEKNAHDRMPTSSMSKTITMAVVFDALKKDQIKLDDTFNVSEKAWRKGGSKMFVELNSDVKIEDLIRGVIVQSGNDATIVLAEGLAGTEDNFARMLNAKAEEYGMENSNFVNASGWPDDNHYSTAYDLALLAAHIVKDYPDYYKYFAEQQFEYNDINQANRNPLLYQGMGADGVKTGHTEDGGYGLIGSAVKDGRRIVVVLNGMDSQETRASESKRVMNWALNGFEVKSINVADLELPPLQVAYGKKSTVTPVLKDDIYVTVPKGSGEAIKFSIDYKAPLIAPITMGDEIATLTIKNNGKTLKTQELYAGETVKRAGFVKRTFQKMKQFYVHKKAGQQS
jgi:D-alanyl-D-alanine carboxypeptidase (penicillin-binding protein 5/6)